MDGHEHGHSLADDLAQLQGRRKALAWIGSGALTVLAACGGGGGGSGSDDSEGVSSNTTTTSTSSSSTATLDSCSVIPSETEGPYPADGTNGPNALTQSGIVRSNIVSSFGSYSGAADGVPLTIKLKLVSVSGSCVSLENHAIYLWHCDQLGRYSLYSSGATSQNYLRGMQVTDANGEATFTSIFPACYDGRWPHIHFEVFSSLARATSGSNDSKTSQIALPAAACAAVYADSRYTGSTSNLARVSLATDMVFADGATLETPEITGSASAGYVIALTVGIA
ncbi:intradiol ring-cleavage dioxygenase [Ramlibacter sp. G-1-2-2]|uniref:Intradiol ring-cleavage dioxygenase n=1 Tax=Ramlibacter agri TaxID=2728837 RepID=A0A848H3I6_9BURK|nr:intradiol ring-cleavage dioxygenase [Ramlibacter agri]NML44121.1 intradiol ring-cleavage dioxygenase [Ramlibacter agri]